MRNLESENEHQNLQLSVGKGGDPFLWQIWVNYSDVMSHHITLTPPKKEFKNMGIILKLVYLSDLEAGEISSSTRIYFVGITKGSHFHHFFLEIIFWGECASEQKMLRHGYVT